MITGPREKSVPEYHRRRISLPGVCAPIAHSPRTQHIVLQSIYMYIYICIYIYVYLHMYIYICVCLSFDDVGISLPHSHAHLTHQSIFIWNSMYFTPPPSPYAFYTHFKWLGIYKKNVFAKFYFLFLSEVFQKMLNFMIFLYNTYVIYYR